MSVDFDEDTYRPLGYNINNSPNGITNTNKIVMFLIKKNIAKDEKQANIILIFVSLIFFTISGFLFKNLLLAETPIVIPYEKMTEVQKAKIPKEIRELIDSSR